MPHPALIALMDKELDEAMNELEEKNIVVTKNLIEIHSCIVSLILESKRARLMTFLI